LSSRSFSRQLPGNHWFRGGGFCCGWFCCGCGSSSYRPRARSATTSAAATTAGRSWFRCNCRGCRGWCRNGLRRGLGPRLRSQWAARLDYRGFGASFGRRGGLIVIVFRLQGLGCVGCFLGGAVSGLLAAL
jgi:hypothetical protein